MSDDIKKENEELKEKLRAEIKEELKKELKDEIIKEMNNEQGSKNETEDEIVERIKKESVQEYKDMKVSGAGKGWVKVLLMLGIVLMIVLIIKTVIDADRQTTSMSGGVEVITKEIEIDVE